MEIISTIKKGRHTKWRWPKIIRHLKCYVTFTESCKYEHGDSDQWDWNKAIGVKQKFFRPMYNSIMLGWRWHPGKQKIQVVPYTHNKGSVNFDFDIVEVDIDEPIYFEVSENGIHYGIYDIPYTKPWKSKWAIINWFGGQKKTPHKLTIKINLL